MRESDGTLRLVGPGACVRGLIELDGSSKRKDQAVRALLEKNGYVSTRMRKTSSEVFIPAGREIGVRSDHAMKAPRRRSSRGYRVVAPRHCPGRCSMGVRTGETWVRPVRRVSCPVNELTVNTSPLSSPRDAERG